MKHARLFSLFGLLLLLSTVGCAKGGPAQTTVSSTALNLETHMEQGEDSPLTLEEEPTGVCQDESKYQRCAKNCEAPKSCYCTFSNGSSCSDDHSILGTCSCRCIKL